MRGRAVFAAACALAAGVSFSCSSEKSTGPSGPPVVTSVNGAASPAGSTGSIVVIAGSNFGTSQANASGQVLFYNGTTSSIAATIAATTDWSNTLIVTTVPAGAVTGAMVVKTSGGTSTPVTFALTQGATFSPSTVSWTAGSALPVGLSGHAVASSFSKVSASTYASTVYLAGGADSTNTPKNTAYYSTVGASGALGAWTSTTALPQPVAFAAAAIASPYNSPATGSGYLYVIGGDSTASGKPVTPVYVGTLNATGGIAGWTTTTALPVPLHSVGAAIFNGTLYVAGGSGVGNVPVATVYSATIGASGALGTWQTLTALPFKRSHFGFGINGTYLYALCGDSGTVTPNDSSLSSTAIGDLICATRRPERQHHRDGVAERRQQAQEGGLQTHDRGRRWRGPGDSRAVQRRRQRRDRGELREPERRWHDEQLQRGDRIQHDLYRWRRQHLQPCGGGLRRHGWSLPRAGGGR
jgi:hypothetical protein